MALGTAAAIAGAVGGLASGIAGVVGAVKAGKRKDKFVGATAEEKASQTRLSAIAQRLGMGQGLTETEYSRGVEQIREGSQSIVAQGTEASRGKLISSALASKLARQTYRSAQQANIRGRETLMSQDLRAARENIKLALTGESMSGQAASKISQAEQKRDMLEYQAKLRREEQMSKAVQNIIKGTTIGAYYMSQFWADGDTDGDAVIDNYFDNLSEDELQSLPDDELNALLRYYDTEEINYNR